MVCVSVCVCMCSPTLAGYGVIPEIRLCRRLEVAVVKDSSGMRMCLRLEVAVIKEYSRAFMVCVCVCVRRCSPTLAGYGIIPEIRLCLRLEVAVVKEY